MTLVVSALRHVPLAVDLPCASDPHQPDNRQSIDDGDLILNSLQQPLSGWQPRDQGVYTPYRLVRRDLFFWKFAPSVLKF